MTAPVCGVRRASESENRGGADRAGYHDPATGVSPVHVALPVALLADDEPVTCRVHPTADTIPLPNPPLERVADWQQVPNGSGGLTPYTLNPSDLVREPTGAIGRRSRGRGAHVPGGPSMAPSCPAVDGNAGGAKGSGEMDEE